MKKTKIFDPLHDEAKKYQDPRFGTGKGASRFKFVLRRGLTKPAFAGLACVHANSIDLPLLTVSFSDKFTDNILSWEKIRERLRNPVMLERAVELHLIRHAETESNAAGKITGSQDVNLTEKGEKQASELGKKLDQHYDIAFFSGLKRSKKTLDIAIESGNVRVDNISKDERLNERSLGILEGGKRQIIPAYAAGDLNYAPQKGETYGEVAQRILSFLIELYDWVVLNEATKKEVTKVLICGHMGPMRIMVGIIEEREDPATVLGFSFPNAEVVRLKGSCLKIPDFLEGVSKAD